MEALFEVCKVMYCGIKQQIIEIRKGRKGIEKNIIQKEKRKQAGQKKEMVAESLLHTKYDGGNRTQERFVEWKNRRLFKNK